MRKNKIALEKPVMAAAGLVFLFALPALTLGQSSPPSAAPSTRMGSRSPSRPNDLLEGLTLTNEQKAKIDQIREDGKSRLAAVANDQKLSPETKEAMLQGYHRIESGKIFEVLTPEQQRDVRRRMHASKTAAQERTTGPATNLQPK